MGRAEWCRRASARWVAAWSTAPPIREVVETVGDGWLIAKHIAVKGDTKSIPPWS
jgi:hypothetical protein